MDIVNRFIKYVMIETTSDRNSTTVPSSDGQLILANLLKGLKSSCHIIFVAFGFGSRRCLCK